MDIVLIVLAKDSGLKSDEVNIFSVFMVEQISKMGGKLRTKKEIKLIPPNHLHCFGYLVKK